MPGPLGFQKPKNATLIYSPQVGRGGHQVIGYSVPSPYGTATYDNNGTPTNNASKHVLADYKKAHPSSGGGLFGSITSGISDFIQDPAKATTQALQPVEKTVNYIGAHPEAQAAIALAVAVPVVGSAIGAELVAAGIVTSEASAAVIGTAIASASAQVAQGVPVEQAVTNATVSAGISTLSPYESAQLNKIIKSPAVTNAIVSTAASGIASAAAGGSKEDIEKSMVAGLAGSSASSLYSGAAGVDPSTSTAAKTIGGAASGAVKGGTEGAVMGGLSSAASSLGSDLSKKDTAPLPTDQVAALQGAQVLDESGQPVGGADIPAANPMAQDPAQQAAAASAAGSEKGAFLPSTTDQQVMDLIAADPNQSAAETARLARKEAELAAAEVTTPAETTKTTEGSKYTPSLFISSYKSPKAQAATTVLGNALGTTGSTTGSTTGLTAERGAGEIEGQGTGGKRKKVWNEESLKLKDALGV